MWTKKQQKNRPQMKGIRVISLCKLVSDYIETRPHGGRYSAGSSSDSLMAVAVVTQRCAILSP